MGMPAPGSESAHSESFQGNDEQYVIFINRAKIGKTSRTVEARILNNNILAMQPREKPLARNTRTTNGYGETWDRGRRRHRLVYLSCLPFGCCDNRIFPLFLNAFFERWMGKCEKVEITNKIDCEISRGVCHG